MMYINEILDLMGLEPLNILMVNVHYYDEYTRGMEIRSTVFQVFNGQHINIHKSMKRLFSQIKVDTIHASKKKIIVYDNEDFNCAVVQNYVERGMNSALDIYINMHSLVNEGHLVL